MEIKDILIKLRKQRGLTQSDIANVLDVTLQAYNRYELGQRKITFEALNQLATFYKLPIQAFFVWDEDVEKDLSDLSISTLGSLFDLLTHQINTISKELNKLEYEISKSSMKLDLRMNDLEEELHSLQVRLSKITSALKKRL